MYRYEYFDMNYDPNLCLRRWNWNVFAASNLDYYSALSVYESSSGTKDKDDYGLLSYVYGKNDQNSDPYSMCGNKFEKGDSIKEREPLARNDYYRSANNDEGMYSLLGVFRDIATTFHLLTKTIHDGKILSSVPPARIPCLEETEEENGTCIRYDFSELYTYYSHIFEELKKRIDEVDEYILNRRLFGNLCGMFWMKKYVYQKAYEVSIDTAKFWEEMSVMLRVYIITSEKNTFKYYVSEKLGLLEYEKMMWKRYSTILRALKALYLKDFSLIPEECLPAKEDEFEKALKKGSYEEEKYITAVSIAWSWIEIYGIPEEYLDLNELVIDGLTKEEFMPKIQYSKRFLWGRGEKKKVVLLDEL